MKIIMSKKKAVEEKTKNKEPSVIKEEVKPEEVLATAEREVGPEEILWKPRTNLGRDVVNGKVKSVDEIFESGRKIKEPEIIDHLLPGLESEIIMIGGSPGKGGGIRRTPTARTARMHSSGRRYKISAMIVVGNKAGYLGLGKAVAIDNRTAIEKAIEEAKLNIIPIKRGCGSWECGCGEPHSIPFGVEGKSGSVRIKLKPAPKGVGLCISDEAKKIMRLAGVSDIWSKSSGNTAARTNLALAIFNAFKNLNKTKLIKEETKDVDEEGKKKKKTRKRKGKEEL